MKSNLESISFGSAAKIFRRWDDSFIHNDDIAKDYKLNISILEIAHAISRGRAPTSSVVKGNIRSWWIGLYLDESGTDYENCPCNPLIELQESASWHWDSPEWRSLNKAIKLCSRYFHKMKLISLKRYHAYQPPKDKSDPSMEWEQVEWDDSDFDE
jgi:hypothetical protein